MYCHVYWENISGTRWEVLVEAAAMAQLINQLLRLLTNRNSRSRSDVLILCDADLCMSKENDRLLPHSMDLHVRYSNALIASIISTPRSSASLS